MDKKYYQKGTEKEYVDLKEKHVKKYMSYLKKRYGKKRADLFSQNAS